MSVNLKAERLNRGLSLPAASEAMDIPMNVIHRAESGDGRPHPANAKVIADFYGYKVTDIWPLEEVAA